MKIGDVSIPVSTFPVSVPGHRLTMQTKPGGPYHDDEGNFVPIHELFSAKCSCGWHGAVFYADAVKAHATWERHCGIGRDEREYRFIAVTPDGFGTDCGTAVTTPEEIAKYLKPGGYRIDGQTVIITERP